MATLNLLIQVINRTVPIQCTTDITIRDLIIKTLTQQKMPTNDLSKWTLIGPSNTPLKLDSTLQSLGINDSSALLLDSDEEEKPLPLPLRSDMYGVPPPPDIEDRMKMIEEIFGDDVPSRDIIYNALQNSYWDIQSAIDFLIPPKRQRLQFTPLESNCIKRMGQHAKLIGDPSLDYVQYFVACERNYFDALALLYETNDIDSALIPENEAKVDQESGPLPIKPKPSETKDEPPLKEVSVMIFGCESDDKSALGNLILSKECFDKSTTLDKESNVVNNTKFVCIHTEDFANNDTVNNQRIARLSKYCNDNHQSLNAMVILVDHLHSYNSFGKGLLKFIYHSFGEKEIFDKICIVLTCDEPLRTQIKEEIINYFKEISNESTVNIPIFYVNWNDSSGEETIDNVSRLKQWAAAREPFTPNPEMIRYPLNE